MLRHRLGRVSLMIALSIALNPMQYVFAEQVDQQVRSLAALASIRGILHPECGGYHDTMGGSIQPISDSTVSESNQVPDDCEVIQTPKPTPTPPWIPPYEPPTTPTPTPTPTPPAGAVSYFVLPGIGDKNPTESVSNYFNNRSLPEYLAASGGQGRTVSINKPFADWKVKGIAAQGNELNADIRAKTSENDSVVLIGHSMGGVRARAALQYGANTAPPQVKALITMGSPNLGAPIINNAIPAAGYFGGILGASILPFLPFGIHPIVGGTAGMFGLRALFSGTVNSPSGQDLAPGSTFMTNLDKSKPLPSNLVTASVLGENNDIDSLAASGEVFQSADQSKLARYSVGAGMTVMGVAAISMGWLTFGFSTIWGLALLAAAALLIGLPTIWRRLVIGSESGDTVVPQSSQPIPVAAGGRSLGIAHLTQAVHIGKYGEYQAKSVDGYTDNSELQKKIRDVQLAIDAPLSPLGNNF